MYSPRGGLGLLPAGLLPAGLLAAALLATAPLAATRPTRAVAAVSPNDNTRPAGVVRRDTLHLRLVVQLADWTPEAPDGPVLRVAAFAEEGGAPQVPAPLIRVRAGTIVSASVRNALADSAITLFGLTTRPAARDSIILQPGQARTLTFAAGAAGTYYYRARIGNPSDLVEYDQAGGAFIVDPPEGSVPDRVFVLNIWGQPLDSIRYSNALTINGKSWPWTERLSVVVGDTVRWRVINATGRPHPMHLHGAYFRVDSKGTSFSDTTYTAEQRRLVVTEAMSARQTMLVTWSPVRPGRWLFHCHINFHVTASDARVVPLAHDDHDAESTDPAQHMAGLVLGIEATMPPGVTEREARVSPRELDLFVQEGAKRGHADRTLSFVLQRGATPPAHDSTEIPGSLLVLTRGQPTDVRVHNRLREATSVHWHGLELESYSDGVAGWGVTSGMSSPPVLPGEVFTARLSTPKAGTFIYHTHLRDQEQLTSGMYGPIVVLEPGTVFDPRTDHVHIVGWDSYRDQMRLLVNGDSAHSPAIEMRVGDTHRLRFINIGAAEAAQFTLTRDSVLAEWRPIAKDGADLPASQRAVRKADVLVDVGETYDFAFTAPSAGEWILSLPTGGNGARWSRRIVVR
ncbi:MAG: multicopper oxidase domain-containing protein [Gemmatimonadetes bacterium]|nr:multicopper oxidase domain-containing protein [Gemmatimonadota bacterium]